MTVDICDDDRFELIEEAKRRLLESTNIEDRPEEVAVLDSILFRFWQMGWLDQLREDKGVATCRKEDDYTCENVSGSWWEFKCSRCGYEVDESPEYLYNSCPCCGRRIKEEDE